MSELKTSVLMDGHEWFRDDVVQVLREKADALDRIAERLNTALQEDPMAVRELVRNLVRLRTARSWGTPETGGHFASLWGAAFGAPKGGWTVAWMAAGRNRNEAIDALEGFAVVKLAPYTELDAVTSRVTTEVAE